jgi:hypothetical protein
MVVRSHILRALAGFALILQLALPFAQANAAVNGVDLASLICNPSGQPVSIEAKIAITELLSAVGEIDPDDGSNDIPPDCERCVSPYAPLLALAVTMAAQTNYDRLKSSQPHAETLAPIAPRGPPCGTRAPPPFI